MTCGVRPFLKGFLSQWHPSNFSVDGIAFGNAEQFMMYKKATLFGDGMIAEKIVAAKHPSDHKRLGQQVRGFIQQDWDANKVEIVHAGNWAKFTQNKGLRKKLLATGNAILVEANPKDIIWGVGLAENDPDITNPDCWRGQNLLGEILMRVRAELADD
ncbi:hypothetical protein GCM10009069_21460 [Algimonas arctica]|uniref:NADAR domain-containing protein n=1 Tax=Algimonas arctica TaxID=1479486 RepID=A0A8J3CS77_9PROT|nr:NADAR family protein [Algimonas arctica]GHA98311.1 hypothetical protein GCM10009069_21460 [Algimonas arctica]